jgi:hypothetical protein
MEATMKNKYTAKQRVFLALMSNVEIEMHRLTSPEIGGVRAQARIDELRKDGVSIEWRFKEDRFGKKTNTTLYRLGRQPDKWTLRRVFPNG